MRLLMGLLTFFLTHQALAQTLQGTKETFGLWELSCIGYKNRTHCAVRTELRRSDDEWVSIEVDPSFDLTLAFITPKEGDAPELSVGYGPTSATKRLAKVCSPMTCIAYWHLTKTQTRILLKGPLTVLGATKGSLAFRFDTGGLAKALAAILPH
jgi:invasion protein IalB